MWVILFKELIYFLFIMGLSALVVFIEAGHIPANWFKLVAAIFLFFPGSTLMMQEAKKISPQAPGWVLMVLSLLKMILIPTILIFLFDRDHEATATVVIPTLIAYLVILGLDTSWKIKWISR